MSLSLLFKEGFHFSVAVIEPVLVLMGVTASGCSTGHVGDGFKPLPKFLSISFICGQGRVFHGDTIGDPYRFLGLEEI